MALPVYIEITGQKQGKFKGGCKRTGGEDIPRGECAESVRSEAKNGHRINA